MPFNTTLSIDGCLKLCETEIRYILCPRRKADTLKYQMERLMERRLLTEETLKGLVRNGEMEPIGEVLKWMETIDSLNLQVSQLLSSLTAVCCCRLHSNYKHGLEVEDLLSRVTELRTERGGWGEDDKLLRRKYPVISAPLPNQIVRDPDANQEYPWSTFCLHMKDGAADLSNQSMQMLAREIVGILVESCRTRIKTLDLALHVVAGALKKHSTVRKWDDAANKLREIAAAHNDSTTGTPVIESILRFCYDSLESDRLRLCLSSCALFKHDRTICESDLIAAWMGEELLDDGRNIDEAYEEGRRMIGKLRYANLLEASDWCDFYLRLDDRIGDVARMAAVDGEIRASDANGDLRLWGAARRVSIRDYAAASLPETADAFKEARLPDGTPVCPHLAVLLVSGNKMMKTIHNDFFRFTPQLRVLDLSDTNIVEIPSSIGLLKLLRSLNLKGTKIRSLPPEFGNLENVRLVDLRDTIELQGILRESISKLSMLQALFLRNTGHRWDSYKSMELSLEDLGRLTGIQRLSLTAKTALVLQTVRRWLSTATTGLTLKDEEFADAQVRSAFSSLGRLESLELNECTRLEELVVENGHLLNLRELELADLHITMIVPYERGSETRWFLPKLRHFGVWGCHSLKNMTWVGHLVKLELVCLQKCSGMTQLIDEDGPEGTSIVAAAEEDDGDISFPNLQFLLLFELPSLRSFSWRHPLRLPSLRTLRVRDCPSLMKLPFGRSSCKDIKEIRGTREWWNGLEWDNADIKLRFGPHFTPY